MHNSLQYIVIMAVCYNDVHITDGPYAVTTMNITYIQYTSCTYLVHGHNDEGEGEGEDHKPPLPVQIRSRHSSMVIISDENTNQSGLHISLIYTIIVIMIGVHISTEAIDTYCIMLVSSHTDSSRIPVMGLVLVTVL